ncbi:hypothetical protein AVEN_249553-1 [Araneus ventricosus]|uniref:Uncharacterized protein n=1 Tax=Araneus ventricosus TaxID=182803 RepID=A0A4Y2S409_ARAVE|nr:hypothetical protein AVEN_249553-1 [Araneus ventricosus]
MKETDCICNSHMLLNHHNNKKHEMNEARQVRIRELRQSLSFSDRNEQRGNSRLRMQTNRLNQLVKLDRIAFQYNSKIEYSLHPVVVVESTQIAILVCSKVAAILLRKSAILQQI